MTEERAPVRVLTVGPAPSAPDSRGGMASVMTLMSEHPDRRIRVRVVPTYVDRPLVSRTVYGLRGMLVATVAILGGRVDVLHVHLAHGGSVVRKSVPLLAARLRGVPTVVHAHSYDFTGWFDGLPRWVRTIVRSVIVADTWLVLGSRHVTDFAPRLDLDEGRFRVLHNPVVLPGPDDTGHPAEPGGRIVAVSVGRLGTRKGSYDVVAAVARLPDDVRDRLRVVLAGDGQIDEVRQAITAAGVDDVIDVRGWQEPADRDELMRSAQVFLLPSYEEGLPMALLESMARGLAPIVSPVGGIPNVVRDGVEGLLVAPGDIDQISAALRTLVEDDDLRERVRAAARRRSEDFDVSRWYGDLSDLWISLADAKRRPARGRR